MLKLEDAVIPMRQNIEQLRFRVGSADVIQRMPAIKPRVPFDPEVMNFLQAFSRNLLAFPASRTYSDIISLAFWCRKASLEQMKKSHSTNDLLIGRGVAFHIAPSNVAVNFAYSLIVGLLTGNINVVRLPSRAFTQVDIICQVINLTLDEHVALRDFICLVEYGHELSINSALSSMCQSRLIWGGNKTISLLREIPLSPRAVDIAFADRYSLAIIHADVYLASKNKRRIAEDFFNDTLLTNQKACTSPKLVVWLGENKPLARKVFWEHFEDWMSYKPAPEATSVINALVAYCQQAAEDPLLQYIPSATRHILRVEAKTVTQEILEEHQGYGLFYEWSVNEIDEILPVCGEKCQTLAILGIANNVVEKFIHTYAPKGIDRVVEVGQTMNFSLHWDGYDLLKTLTRTLSSRRS